MDALNSVTSRSKLTPMESMQVLERAILLADQRSRIRRDVTARAQLYLGLMFATPAALYFIYHFFHPNGVMHNNKSAAGNYMWWPQNFMYIMKPQTQIWRPEFYQKEMHSSLHLYSKKI